MSLLGLLLSPVRSVLSGSLRQVFEADVRHNPTIVNPIRQSDDDDSYRKERQLGFAPQYVVSLRRPRTDLEAQRLYNHIRTVSWYLDAIPVLGRRLPFNIGVEVSNEDL
jgi:predicted RNA-binding protein